MALAIFAIMPAEAMDRDGVGNPGHEALAMLTPHDALVAPVLVTVPASTAIARSSAPRFFDIESAPVASPSSILIGGDASACSEPVPITS